MITLQKSLTNLTQILRLYEHRQNDPDFERLGAIDVYYLEAIYQLKEPTIGMISRLLDQSTPNTNYHIKKLMKMGLIEKRLDDVDRRVTHLLVTDKYRQMLETNEEFWQRLENRLEDEIAPKDLAIFKRVLRQTTDIVSEEGLDEL
ncbi:MAG: MarR family winged helix-turn-helix transcriptional regulator [Liquorilactobacillus nagelii]|jgi:DNA-binding MarR family transcriptional regulator|uniref:MarR family transcriptional regulator n=1 Tax=Liquorilactobacillus nagelii TaxID=82688 RepID=A0A3Q8CND3_9LACO|nr:MarR family winged helix-turn-helix transcriptional regulator [Liquorilactobacillus nagelii]AUJ31356.1 MarR family transcriptional regulator [Liquorilactobacillus nagelii]KRL40385.1 MarR family transcriptional regulator [Liquorilactobacillus nagelii DSM 13675]MCC7616833.1 MarR family transcriptional regulator [Liquorilactobacillus nagelii]MCI1633447.1 MarR family winged helix-turn-helix transcriptional regulator [Liquorilactobacillus nagelii]MCI1700306.1 MarR family winged helix-turn-helix 